MMRLEKRGWSAVAAGCWVLVCLTGCGGAYDASVTGVVTLDGSPIGRGTVAYHPVNGGPAGYARIDSSGDYTVQTGREEGLPSGDYEVTVVANEPPTMERTKLGGPPPPGKPITPPWYRTTQTSGLQFTVDRGSNTIDLELSTQPPPGYQPRGRR